MHKKNTLILFLLLAYFFVNANCIAQSSGSFSLSPQEITMIKDETFPFVYAPSDIKNLTDSPLELVWQRYMPADFPAEWTTTFQDPATWHNSHEIERDTFELQVDNDEFDKMILQVYPNGAVGEARVDFNIYDANNPSDSLSLTYFVKVEARVLANEQEPELTSISVYPNPASEFLFFSEVPDSFVIYDSQGKIVLEQHKIQNRKVTLPSLSSGVYFLRLSQGEKEANYRLLVE